MSPRPSPIVAAPEQPTANELETERARAEVAERASADAFREIARVTREAHRLHEELVCVSP